MDGQGNALQLDAKLTEQGTETKIVFLLYVDLLWEPVEEKLANPSRFIMMFAPITRDYGKNYSDFLEYNGELRLIIIQHHDRLLHYQHR